MGAASTYVEEATLNHWLRGTAAPAAPAAVYVALFTTDPTDDDTGAEVAAAEYERQQATFTAPAKVSGRSEIENTTAILFPVAESNWGTVTHVGLYDALTEGNLLWHGSVPTPKAYDVNDQASFPEGELKVALD